jgi:hypothetical protein
MYISRYLATCLALMSVICHKCQSDISWCIFQSRLYIHRVIPGYSSDVSWYIFRGSLYIYRVIPGYSSDVSWYIFRGSLYIYYVMSGGLSDSDVNYLSQASV